MATITVSFTFHSGVKRPLFSNVRLSGSWNAAGQFSNQRSQQPMTAYKDETGCDAFHARVSFDSSQAGTTFQWGALADLAGVPNSWVIVTEVPDPNSSECYRTFVLANAATQQDYWFVTGRCFGAQKWTPPRCSEPRPSLFSVGAACACRGSDLRTV